MKTLKTLLVACLLTLGFAGASAQQFNWGFKGGFNASTLSSEDNFKFRPGGNIGLVGQFMFTGHDGLGLETGLYYSLKGYNDREMDDTYSASYLELPVQLIYKMDGGPGLYIYPAAGLYVAYGMGGSKVDGVEYFDHAKDFDFGWTVGLNLEYQKFLFGVGYEQGFLNAVKKNHKNQNIMLSVGYLF